jgi:hypothetical protein
VLILLGVTGQKLINISQLRPLFPPQDIATISNVSYKIALRSLGSVKLVRFTRAGDEDGDVFFQVE